MKISRQKKISISFKENDKEVQLYNWLVSKGEILGCSGVIKEILIKAMDHELSKEKE